MTTHEFMQSLQKAKKAELRFQFGQDREFPWGYHITEVKNARIESVDCGGAKDQWTETVIQLWLPPTAESDRFTATKALGILRTVHKLSPLDREAPCRFEAENASGVMGIYDVQTVDIRAQTLVVHLGGAKTQCKAKQRDTSACCGTPAEPAKTACCS